MFPNCRHGDAVERHLQVGAREAVAMNGPPDTAAVRLSASSTFRCCLLIRGQIDMIARQFAPAAGAFLA